MNINYTILNVIKWLFGILFSMTIQFVSCYWYEVLF